MATLFHSGLTGGRALKYLQQVAAFFGLTKLTSCSTSSAASTIMQVSRILTVCGSTTLYTIAGTARRPMARKQKSPGQPLAPLLSRTKESLTTMVDI